MKRLILIAVFSMSCGNDRVETKEVTKSEETKYETRTECEWQTQCRTVRSKRRSKWGRSCTKRICERVQVCEDVVVPVSI